MICKKICVICEICVTFQARAGLQEKKIPRDYLLCLSLQKKCQVLKMGSLNASAGKYLMSLISLYTLWRLCPSFDFPNRFLSSCFPKFPASSTSFSTNLPYFSFGGTISREAGMPNTSCMIYMIPPANFHNPNSFISIKGVDDICILMISIRYRSRVQNFMLIEIISEAICPFGIP